MHFHTYLGGGSHSSNILYAFQKAKYGLKISAACVAKTSYA